MFTSRLVSRLSRPLKITSRAASSSSAAPTTSTGTSIAESKPSLPSVPQAPNYPTTWSTNQRKRPVAGEGPRFEQTNMELQPQPLSAMEMINAEPIRIVHGRRAVCDGGGGPLGHPKIFINLDKPGARPCGYCGLRFEQAPHHH